MMRRLEPSGAMPSPQDDLTLDRLLPGERGEVRRVSGDDAVARRLGDLGLWPGTPIEVIRRAPFGDPTQYRLRGFRLALRRDEAQRVLIERLTGDA